MSGEMDGGDFAVNTGGLDHYKKHGYKGSMTNPHAACGQYHFADVLTIPC
jgi:hypothetical protein